MSYIYIYIYTHTCIYIHIYIYIHTFLYLFIYLLFYLIICSTRLGKLWTPDINLWFYMFDSINLLSCLLDYMFDVPICICCLTYVLYIYIYIYTYIHIHIHICVYVFTYLLNHSLYAPGHVVDPGHVGVAETQHPAGRGACWCHSCWYNIIE